MKKIVLTGGPCAGKTAVLNALKENFKDKVVVVEEIASLLFDEGYPAPNPWTLEWEKAFQAKRIERQKKEELIAYEKAVKRDAKIIVCDRGIMDGAAYMKGGKEEFLNLFGMNENDVYNDYDIVIHLESLATLNPDKFNELVSTNPHRYEGLDLAQEREHATRAAWEDHPKRCLISNSIDKSIAMVTDIIAKEIE